MATISDVARQAGVSRTAVSFAFNDPSQLSAATLRRILEVADELGYYPNPSARTLTTKRIGALGLLVPHRSQTVFANPFFTEFLHGVGIVCDRHGFSLLLIPPHQGSLTRALNGAAVDGFVGVGMDSAHDESRLLARRGAPFVMVDGDPLPDVRSVNVDDTGGAFLAAKTLLDSGHRHILILAICPPHIDHTSLAAPTSLNAGAFRGVVQRRLEGYMAAFAAAGVQWSSEWVVYQESTRDGGRQAFEAIWQSGKRPTAILAMSDICAIGAMIAAREMGVSVPDDLEIIGFDDIELASLVIPALSTVRQPSVDKGIRAAQMVIDEMERQSHSRRAFHSETIDHVTLPTTLVLRETTRSRKGVIVQRGPYAEGA